MIDTKALPIDDIDTNWRFETKYRINSSCYLALKNAFAPFLKTDSFTKKSSAGKYFVRSLYFDTFDYKLYTEKIDGICNRMKFRIRTYGMNPDSDPDIRVEIKVRKGNIIEKYGSFIKHEEYINFMKSRYWSQYEDAVLSEFSRYIHKWNLQPKTLIQYLREGYQTKGVNGLRITFDHHVKSASSKELFPGTIIWHQHHLSEIVLEIKHKNETPEWLSKTIKEFGLKVVSNSKYCNSIDFSERNYFDRRSYFL